MSLPESVTCFDSNAPLRAADVFTWLERAIKPHGAPAFLRSDNGPEFIANEVQHWLAHNQIKAIYIDPGSPWRNGFVESFHARVRDECLDREQLWTLTGARVVNYNERRSHSKLGYQSPACFAALLYPLTPSSLAEAGQNHPTQRQPTPNVILPFPNHRRDSSSCLLFLITFGNRNCATEKLWSPSSSE